MTDNGDRGFSEDGIRWEGTRAQLEAWKEYKRHKARAFVDRGYAVSWTPDGYDWMDIYVPERPYARAHELRAEVQLLVTPEQAQADGSRIAGLTIFERRVQTVVMLPILPNANPVRVLRDEQSRIFYNDGPAQVKLLKPSPDASQLHTAILEEFR